MKFVGVIPARFASTRLPGKPLKMISGKPLLQWVIEGVSPSKKLSELIVATDHDEIFQLAENCGVKAIMTDSDLPSGSDRVWSAVSALEADVVINIQGDEPLIESSIIDQLCNAFEKEPEIKMATLAREHQTTDLADVTTAKIVLDKNGHAIYFSRFPIPYSREKNPELMGPGCLIHIGMYAYKKDFLKTFCEQKPTVLELYEGLEQLRALYLGAKIKVLKVDHHSWGVDTQSDIAIVEELIAKREKE